MSVHSDVLSRRASVEREKLTAAFDALEDELRAVADWREYVRNEPMLTLGIAALGGAILGAASAPRRRASRSRTGSALLNASEAVVGSAASGALLRRAGGFLLDLVMARALTAYRGHGDETPRATEPAQKRRTAEAAHRSR